MFKRILLIAFSALLMVSCATMGTAPQNQPQEVVVKVQASEPAQVRVQNGEHINKSMEVPNQEGHLSQLSFISKDKAFVKIFSGLSVSDVTRLWNDLCVLENNTNIRDVSLFINSPGGRCILRLSAGGSDRTRPAKGISRHRPRIRHHRQRGGPGFCGLQRPPGCSGNHIYGT